ncbi:Kinase [Zostera marina]|uniref:Kinase n=1 Tax=Zostera marina TaxID=29655 RepID=A0A0K9NNN5_ZOSMR|nr:Kinase [Zostera marina]
MWKNKKKSTTFSVNKEDYKLKEEVGHGASATVYRAIYLPLDKIVAVKCLDLDRCNSNLDDVRREAQTMSLINHPNLISAHCSFVVEHYLWVVMPFMAEGSCLHLMKIAYPEGFDEHIICSILKETLKALVYLHSHGHIHRDVKSGNILLDRGGIVKLCDFGVSACMFDKGDRQRSRNTFVGTPCWMAPEVLQPGGGYDFKADIWSFGITALELAHGHAPFSKYPPMKVLLMTIQNAPPELDYDRDKKFSKSFKEIVSMCLVKDQTKRPTAEKLLKHPFFKGAKSPENTVKNLLAGLAPLWDRVKQLQLKDAAQLALRKMPSAAEEALSQSEYKRGVSAWNFDIEDMKRQASLIQEDEEFSEVKEDKMDPSIFKLETGKSVLKKSDDNRFDIGNQPKTDKYKQDARKAPNFSGPLMLSNRASANSLSAPTVPVKSLGGNRDMLRNDFLKSKVQIKGRFSVTSENVDIVKDIPICTGSTAPISSSQFINEIGSSRLPTSILVPHLQNLYQQTSFQHDLIDNLLNSLHQTDQSDDMFLAMSSLAVNPKNDLLFEPAASEREQLLLMKISDMQTRVSRLTDELTTAKIKHAQLVQEISNANREREDRKRIEESGES